MKFISWNVDSLNASLISGSNREVITGKVVYTIIDKDDEVIASQKTKLLAKGQARSIIARFRNIGQDKFELFGISPQG